MESLVASSVNFLILVTGLFVALKKPFQVFVAQRHQSIRDELISVRDQLRSAQDKYDEFSSKLKAIDAELMSLREQTKQDGQALKARMVMDAKRNASTVVSDAKTASDGLYSELKGQLYSELTSKVLEKAEGLLKERLTGDDRVRIRREFSQQVETIR